MGVNKAQVRKSCSLFLMLIIELSAKYPEVVINTDAIVCTVNFINEGAVP